MTFDTSDPIIKRRGASAVIYDLSRPGQTTITLPTGSTWTSGLHWHETHDEYLQVIQGSIHVRLGQQMSILRAGQEAKVPKFARHEWSRVDINGGEDVIVIERTEPVDDEKHLFFWNLNGVILTSKVDGFFGEWLIMLRLFMIFHELDNWPVLVELSYTRRFLSGVLAAQLESALTHAILYMAAAAARTLDFRAVDKRLTPPILWQGWDSETRRKEL